MDGTTPVHIPAGVLAQVYDHARAAFPDECCGYLTGCAGSASVDTAVACRNAQCERIHPIVPGRGADTAYAFSGADLVTFAKAFGTDHPPLVVYHSHPNGRASFSATDRAVAMASAYPVQHVVVAVDRGAVTEVAQLAWCPVAGEYVEVARWTQGAWSAVDGERVVR